LGEVSESDRAVINEVILKLEALNPTVDPALSPLLNGEWELRYSGGYSSEGALQSPTRQLALFLYSGGYRYVIGNENGLQCYRLAFLIVHNMVLQ
jgi:hypothetical protein